MKIYLGYKYAYFHAKLGNFVTKNAALRIDMITNPILIDIAVTWSSSAIYEELIVATLAVTLQNPKTVEHNIVGMSCIKATKL